MFGKTKSLFLIVASMLCMASCDSISEDLPRCELWLEFVFDYNMEYADAFNPQVKSVDVLVFDSDDKLLFTKSAKVAALVGGNRMSLTDELDFGSYKVLTVGSLSDRFRLSDNAGNKLVPGTTTLQQVIVSLKREMGVVNFEFQHLYFGEVVEVDHLPSNTNHKIYPVNLIRDTNRFNLALMGYEEIKWMAHNIHLKFRHRKMRFIPGKTNPQDKGRLLMCLTIQVRVKYPMWLCLHA